jgi:hypothetical protein
MLCVNVVCECCVCMVREREREREWCIEIDVHTCIHEHANNICKCLNVCVCCVSVCVRVEGACVRGGRACGGACVFFVWYLENKHPYIHIKFMHECIKLTNRCDTDSRQRSQEGGIQ